MAGFSNQHAGLDRAVRSLDARSVKETGIVADQRTTEEDQFGQRLQAASGDAACAIGDTLAAFKEGAQGWMRFEALELLVRREVGVAGTRAR